MGKKYKDAIKAYDFSKNYSMQEAIDIIKEITKVNFDSSLDVAINLGIDPKKSDQIVRGVCKLPHGNGQNKKVLVLCNPDKLEEAKGAKADHVGLEEYLEKIEKGWLDIDVIVTTPDLMHRIAKLGKVLGPKGLMPNPKTDTVVQDIGNAVKEIKSGKVMFKNDKSGIIHASIGKVSFSNEFLENNLKTFITHILQQKPNVKGTYLKKITISSTMSKAVTLENKF